MSTTAIAPTTVVCPKCQGPVWDQQGSKFWGNGLFKSGKQKPRWECKNKECGGAVWDKATPAAAPAKPSGPQPISYGHPEFLADVDRQESADLAAKIGFDISTIQKELALYHALAEFVVRDIAPIYEAGKVGMSPESAAASVQTLYINITESGKLK